jgi:hypothetical protein
MAEVRLFELSCAVVATIFATLGLFLFSEMHGGGATKHNIDIFAQACTIFMFNAAAAIVCLHPASEFSAYFGYLQTWTGRALHFLMMGFYLYPLGATGCPSGFDKDISGCYSRVSDFHKVVLVAAITSIVLGTILLVQGCCLHTGGEPYKLNCGYGVVVDLLGLCSAIASVGLLVYGFLRVVQAFEKHLLQDFFEALSPAFFLLTFGVASLLSSVHTAPTVAMLFGFLYNLFGRGLFYLCMGFFMYARSHHTTATTRDALYYISSVLAMVVGGIYLVLWAIVSHGDRHPPDWAAGHTSHWHSVKVGMPVSACE